MHKSLVLVTFMLMTACGGSGQRAFFGGVIVEANDVGGLANVPSDAVERVSFAENGFVYGFAAGLDAQDFNSGAPGDTANFVVAGLLSDNDVGTPITSGTAQFSGLYEFLTLTGTVQSANPRDWEREEFSGTVTAEISFDTLIDDLSLPDEPSTAGGFEVIQNDMILTAESSDGRFAIRRSTIADLVSEGNGGAGPFDTSLSLTLNGRRVSTNRAEVEVGENGVVAAFAGSDRNILFSGGISAR